VVATAVLVDVQQCDDQSLDDADTGVVSTATLVVGDDRRGDREPVCKLGLCDIEISAPLPECRPRVVAECDFAGDFLGELVADTPCHYLPE